jgi:phytoene desaturase
VCNVDVGTVYRDMLPEGAVSRSRRQAVARFDPSCSGFVLLLGVEGQHADLAHHNIFFSGAYRDEFDAIFHRGVPSDDPTIYVAITAKTDPDHAPPGTENWFVLVNAPPLGNAFDWTTQASAYRDLVLVRLAARGYDVRSRLCFERILTPLDLERQTGAWRGALYGMSMNHRLAPFRRPHNRCPDVRGLFFAGGTTHPGGGVPMVMLSAKVAAAMALESV